jgi:acetoacetyl-CoA synthetase
VSNPILWQPSKDRIDAANITAFTAFVNARHGDTFTDYDALHAWSLADKPAFWRAVADFAGLTAETWGETGIVDADAMPGAQFFPDARLNFAENLLSRTGDEDALVFWGEDQIRRRLGWTELTNEVSLFAQALRAEGVVAGDRVAGYLPNVPEAIIAMLAATSIGAVWCSCSPDFGVDGVLDRFRQIDPRILVSVDGYIYAGKTHDCVEKTKAVMAALPSVTQCIVVPYIDNAGAAAAIKNGISWDNFVGGFTPGPIDFAPLAFDHPLYIMFSSGTTGAPKCIVHRAGGVLLKQVSEHVLHCDIKPGDRVFYFTTCSWMMWNWLVAALAAKATLLLYDGSPFHPSGNVLFDFADAENMTLFGTSAKYIDALSKAGLKPRQTHSLATVRTMTSTGSPLAPASFDYVYSEIKPDLHLASIAGGTDLLGCFVLGNPTQPVHRGEIQCRALGMATAVFDDEGHSLRGEKGELVCTEPFPSMPLGFWNDPDGERYRAAYFERFPGIWHHGDYVALTETGGTIMYGRSDATLNPGGVRIGTAEIYRQVEKLEAIKEALVIGQDWQGDVRVVLFVVLQDGQAMNERLEKTIRAEIRTNCTPRHVPAKIIAVADIPRTKSGKITELAVREIIHGRPIKNAHALANPESLDQFRHIDALQG